jgi:hypothetical protein
VHGDGVPVVGVGKSWSKGVEAYSWTSLLCEGTPSPKHWLLIALQKHTLCKAAGRDTIHKAWHELAWSFNALFEGTHPSTNSSGEPWPPHSPEAERAGKPLAGGRRGVLWALRGDLEYFSNSLHLEHFASGHPCFLCRADCKDDSMPWVDTRPTAKWRATCWDDDEVGCGSEVAPWGQLFVAH